MKVANLSSAAGLSDPGSPDWQGLGSETVALSPVPLEAQSNAYIQESWSGKEYGKTPEVRVVAASGGGRLYIRLEWSDDVKDHGEFKDAAGALFPINGGGALATLGSAESPLAIWFWEDGRPAGLSLKATGPGVFRREEGGDLAATGTLNDGTWSVVFEGPADVASRGSLGVAVWNGSNDERAGLAAVSRDWLALEME